MYGLCKYREGRIKLKMYGLCKYKEEENKKEKKKVGIYKNAPWLDTHLSTK
jgi:hypothetical protein